VIAAALGRYPERPDATGLVGLVLSPAAFAAMHGSQAPYVPLDPPAEVRDAATTFRHHAFAAERRATSLLRTMVFESVPEGILAATPDYDHVGSLGHRGITLVNLMGHLRTIYGTPSVGRHQAALAAIQEPQGTRSLEELIGEHVRQHAIARVCGQPIPEAAQIRSLLASLQPRLRTVASHSYRMYAEGEASFATHRFAPFMVRLRTALRAAEDVGGDFCPEEPSSTALAARTPFPARDPVLVALKDLTARLDRLTVEKKKEGHASPASSSASPSRPRRDAEFCWTHGPGAHASRDCRNPKAGHQPSATLRDKKGAPGKGRR